MQEWILYAITILNSSPIAVLLWITLTCVSKPVWVALGSVGFLILQLGAAITNLNASEKDPPERVVFGQPRSKPEQEDNA